MPINNELIEALGSEFRNCMTNDGRIDITKLSEEKIRELNHLGLIPNSDLLPITDRLAKILGSQLSACMTNGLIDLSKVPESKRNELEKAGLVPPQREAQIVYRDSPPGSKEPLVSITNELASALGNELAGCMKDGKIDVTKISDYK